MLKSSAAPTTRKIARPIISRGRWKWVPLLLFLFFAPNSRIFAEANKVPVLIYHQITIDEPLAPGETVITLNLFEQQMRYLSEAGYNTVSLEELIGFMKGQMTLPEKSVVLTFDDGWRNVANALPILKKYGFKASFWLITGEEFAGAYLGWDDVVRIDQDPAFEIGSHTTTHPWSPDCNLLTWSEGRHDDFGIKEIQKEIVGSKKTLEKHLKRKVDYLAWPCGWYNKRLVGIAKKAGYKALLTTIQESNQKGDDVFAIKRIFVYGTWTMAQFREMLETGLPPKRPL